MNFHDRKDIYSAVTIKSKYSNVRLPPPRTPSRTCLTVNLDFIDSTNSFHLEFSSSSSLYLRGYDESRELIRISIKIINIRDNNCCESSIHLHNCFLTVVVFVRCFICWIVADTARENAVKRTSFMHEVGNV